MSYQLRQIVYVIAKESSYWGQFALVVDVRLPNLFELLFNDGHRQWFSIDEISA